MYLNEPISESNVPVIRVYKHQSSLSHSFIHPSETEYTPKNSLVYSSHTLDTKSMVSSSLSRNSSLPLLSQSSLLPHTPQKDKKSSITKARKAVTDHTSDSLSYSQSTGKAPLSPTAVIQARNTPEQTTSNIIQRPSTFHETAETKKIDSYLKKNGFAAYTLVPSDDATVIPALTPDRSSNGISESSSSSPQPTHSSGADESLSISKLQKTPSRFTFEKLPKKKVEKNHNFFRGIKRKLIPSSKRRKHNVPAPFNHDSREIREKYGDFGKQLGSGAGGIVRLIKRAQDNKIFAVKQFRRREAYESQRLYLKKVLAEFCIGSTLFHENIVKTLDIVEENGFYFEILEFIPYDLFDLVMSQEMVSDEITCLFKQLLNGVRYLSEMGIAHRDLKLDNCVVNEHGILKIIDFGCSVVFKYPFSDKILLASGACGSDPYISPESHLEVKYDPRAADIWSVGVIVVCMTIGRFPFMCAKPEIEPAYKAFVEDPNRVLKRLPEESKRLIAKMLEPDPVKRVTIDQAWIDEWIRSSESCGEERVSKGHVHHLPESMNKSKNQELVINSSSGITLLDESKLVDGEKSNNP